MSTPEEIENKAKRLMEAAEGESSRSKIILFATQIDECLEALLKKQLKDARAKHVVGHIMPPINAAREGLTFSKSGETSMRSRMKTIVLMGTIFVACSFLSLANSATKITTSGSMKPHQCSTCTGSDPCHACKNCHYCKHCAKEGGTCGVCKR